MLFRSGGEEDVVALLRSALMADHGLNVPVIVRRADLLAEIRHPGEYGPLDPKFLHVLFLDRVLEPTRIGAIDQPRFQPDTFVLGEHEIFVSHPNGAGRSRLGIEVFERAFGVTATARNLNTVRALIELAGQQ